MLAPHTDDGEFGCGGTIARFVEQGTFVRYVAFSTANLPATLGAEVKQATTALGVEQLDLHDFPVRRFHEHRQEILEVLVGIWEEWRPDFVLQPSSSDIHQDHQVVAEEGLRAFKRTTVLGYELPWNNYRFDYQAFVTLDRRHVDTKARALACYESQRDRPYADPGYLEAQTRVHGVQAGCEWAEAFEVYRVVV